MVLRAAPCVGCVCVRAPLTLTHTHSIPIFVGFLVESFVTSHARVVMEMDRQRAHRQLKREQRAKEARARKDAAKSGDAAAMLAAGLDVEAATTDNEIASAAAHLLYGVAGEGDEGGRGGEGGGADGEDRYKMVLKRKNSDVNYATLNVEADLATQETARLEEMARVASARAAFHEERVLAFARRLMDAESRVIALERELAVARGEDTGAASSGLLSPASRRRATTASGARETGVMSATKSHHDVLTRGGSAGRRNTEHTSPRQHHASAINIDRSRPFASGPTPVVGGVSERGESGNGLDAPLLSSEYGSMDTGRMRFRK